MSHLAGQVAAMFEKRVVGKTVLDLGGYNGEQAHKALQAGASSAVCVDNGSWQIYEWSAPSRYEGVEYVDDDIFNYDKAADVVILQNVVYHFRNPWALLEHVRKLTREKLILVSSVVKSTSPKRPMWICYYPHEGHPVSWTVAWRPTREGLRKLLEATGFKDVAIRHGDGEDDGEVAVECSPGDLPIGFGERK